MESLVNNSHCAVDTPSTRSGFWSGKRVLVTGHTGFKGSWLTLWLRQLGAEVVGFALPPPTTPNLFEQGRVAEGGESVVGDVRDLDAILDTMRQHQPEIVFHLAAQSLVRPSYQNPVETYATNVMGTIHVLEAMRQVGSTRVGVVVTSDKCYENQESMLWGYRENDPMGGHDPYSNSKGCAELVTAAYRSSFFQNGGDPSVAVASVRAGNVIGGGDWADDRLVPDIIRAFQAHRAVRIRRPDAIRPWQHVLEPLRGYLTLARHLWADGSALAGGWNFGPADTDAQPVRYVVERMIDHWGGDASAAFDPGPHPHEATYLRLDCSKARTLLDWQPCLPLDEALAWTVEWYQAVEEEKDPRATTLDQLRRYEHLVSNPTAHDLHERSSP